MRYFFSVQVACCGGYFEVASPNYYCTIAHFSSLQLANKGPESGLRGGPKSAATVVLEARLPALVRPSERASTGFSSGPSFSWGTAGAEMLGILEASKAEQMSRGGLTVRPEQSLAHSAD
jgi:hypothetical protein